MKSRTRVERRRPANELCHGRGGKLVTGDYAVDPHPLRTAESWRHVAVSLVPDGPVTEQAISAARLCFQQTTIRSKRLANRARMDMKRVFPNDRAWPDPIQELVLGHELADRPG